MKELELNERLSEKQSIEAVEKQQQQTEITYESSIIPHKNHSVFEIDPNTLTVRKAEFIVEKTIDWFDALNGLKSGFNKKIMKKRGCVYISALNAKNALKRYLKGKGSAKKESLNWKLF